MYLREICRSGIHEVVVQNWHNAMKLIAAAKKMKVNRCFNLFFYNEPRQENPHKCGENQERLNNASKNYRIERYLGKRERFL